MRKYLVVVLALAALVIGSVIPAFAQDRPSIPDLLSNDSDGRFTTFLTALQAAGLTDTLSGTGPFTVLAPTNDAFTAAMTAMNMSPAQVLANPELLTKILTYHVIPQRLFARQLYGGATATTVEGEDVTFGEGDGGVLAVNGVNISDVDLLASNGVVHILDGVLVPPSVAAAMAAAAATPEATVEAPAATPEPTAAPTAEATTAAATGQAEARPSIVDLLTNDADARFTTLLTILQAADPSVVAALSGAGPMTVLAPTNDAIAASLQFLGITQDDLLANSTMLTQVLTYHVLPQLLLSRNMFRGVVADTVNGASVSFYRGARGRLTVNGATISDVDNFASNGVVQVVDSMLIPPGVFPSAHVRVAHFSPDAPAVDLWMNNQLNSVQNLAFGSVSTWLEIAPNPALSVALDATGTSDAAVAPVAVAFAPGSWTTLAAVGTVANTSLTLQAIPEDYSAIPSGTARVTFFHAIEGGPAVNIYGNGSLLVGGLGFPGSSGSNDGVFTVSVHAGTYNLVVNANGAPFLTLSGTDLVAGTNYFVAAIGTADAPQLIVQPTDQTSLGQ